MERMALDPLSAVEDLSEVADRLGDLHSERLLDRVHGRRLIGDRADPADPGGHVDRIRVASTLEQGLDEAGRFEDLELNVFNLAVFDFQI